MTSRTIKGGMLKLLRCPLPYRGIKRMPFVDAEKFSPRILPYIRLTFLPMEVLILHLKQPKFPPPLVQLNSHE
jgi:hypothetical protein